MEKQNVINRQSYLWNTIGSILGAGSSFFLLLCVTRTVGVNEGGIFSLAFASAQLLLTLGKYGVRSYQATDVSKVVSASTYLIARIITCIAMLVMCGVVIVLFRYDGHKAGIVFAVCVMKMVDAVEDVYHGQLQLCNKLDVAGKLLAFRNVYTMLFFAVIIILTRNLLLSSWITGISSLVVCVVCNHAITKKYERISITWKWKELKFLFPACFPLFLGYFLSLFIYNAPKYAIDMYCSVDMQTYYAIIFMPTFVINMFSEFVFKPMLTSLAMWWNGGELKKFTSTVTKLVVNILVVTIGVLIVMFFLGTPILSLVYGVDVNGYRRELMLLLLGGGFSAAVYFLYNVLTAMRMQKEILMNYLLAAVFILIVSFATIKSGGILLAAVSYVLAEAILCMLMLRSVGKGTRKKDRGVK